MTQHATNWALSPISRRGASTLAVDEGMSAHPKKQINLSYVVLKANGGFEAVYAVGDAAPASVGSEPRVPNAVVGPNWREACIAAFGHPRDGP